MADEERKKLVETHHIKSKWMTIKREIKFQRKQFNRTARNKNLSKNARTKNMIPEQSRSNFMFC